MVRVATEETNPLRRVPLHLVRHDFLSAAEHAALLDWVLEREGDLVPSTLGGDGMVRKAGRNSMELKGRLPAASSEALRGRMLAQLPGVRRDADNPTAAAFRTAEMKTIPAGDGINGALVVPLMTPEGCAGVLALELRNGGEQATTTRGAATIMGAMLAQLVGPVRAAEPEPQIEVDPTFENFAASIRREHARR